MPDTFKTITNTNRADIGSSSSARTVTKRPVPHSTSRPNHIPKVKPNKTSGLTLITGSCSLKDVSIGRLDNKVEVKSFNSIKASQLREKLKNMDLEPYEKIILHIGDSDVSGGSDVATVKSSIHNLILDLKPRCDVVVSGLLTRAGHDLKPFNLAIKQHCNDYDVEFIDHHDSFLMASGEIPKSLFCSDKVNLRPLGTASLVSNIDSVFKILRKHDKKETSLRPRWQPNAGDRVSNPIWIWFKAPGYPENQYLQTDNRYHALNQLCYECDQIECNEASLKTTVQTYITSLPLAITFLNSNKKAV